MGAVAAVFNTLAYAKKLEAVGVPVQIAEVQAEALAEALEQQLASKQDVINTETVLKQEIANVRTELKQEIADIRTELKQEIGDVKKDVGVLKKFTKVEIEKMGYKLTARISGMIIAGVVLLETLHKLI